MPTNKEKLDQILVIAIYQPSTIFILMMFVAICRRIGLAIHTFLIIHNIMS